MLDRRAGTLAGQVQGVFPSVLVECLNFLHVDRDAVRTPSKRYRLTIHGEYSQSLGGNRYPARFHDGIDVLVCQCAEPDTQRFKPSVNLLKELVDRLADWVTAAMQIIAVRQVVCRYVPEAEQQRADLRLVYLVC